MRASDHRSLKLTPALSQFIENFARYFESYGISRIGGRILGLLMVAQEPLSAEAIASTLKVSRASISTNLRFALNIGLAEKISFLGDRLTYYIFPENGLEGTLAIEIQGLQVMKKLIQQGSAALPPESQTQERMQGLADWADFLIHIWEKALDEWQTTQKDKRRIQS